jgi:hypothetical protein
MGGTHRCVHLVHVRLVFAMSELLSWWWLGGGWKHLIGPSRCRRWLRVAGRRNTIAPPSPMPTHPNEYQLESQPGKMKNHEACVREGQRTRGRRGPKKVRVPSPHGGHAEKYYRTLLPREWPCRKCNLLHQGASIQKMFFTVISNILSTGSRELLERPA